MSELTGLDLGGGQTTPKPALVLAGAVVNYQRRPGNIVAMQIGHVALPITFELHMSTGDIGNVRLALASIEAQLRGETNGETETGGA